MVKQKFFSGFFLFLFSVFLFSPDRAEAATCAWIGGTGTNASTAANWSDCGGQAPQSTDDVVINATSDEISWDASAGSTVASLTLGASFGGSLTLSKTLAVSGAFTMNAGSISLAAYTLNLQGESSVNDGSISGSSGTLVLKNNFSIASAGSVSVGAIQTYDTGSIGGAGTFTTSSFTVNPGFGNNATTTLAGNITASGSCKINAPSGGRSVLKLSTYTLSCGSFENTNNLTQNNETYIYVESGALTVSTTTSITNTGAGASTTVAFYGGTGTLNFNGNLNLNSVPSVLASGPHQVIFDAGESGNMSVGGDLNAYAASTIGVSFANPLLFFGNGKNITVDGAMFVDSLGANGLTFNAGTSGSFTVSGTSTILKVEGTTSNATTTFNGQAKNITLTNGLNIQKGSSALGEVFFTPSTGTNAYDLTINKPSGYLSLATTSTVTGGLTVTAGTLYVNGTTTVTGDISNSDTIITNYPLKKSASGSLNASSYMLGTDSSLSVTLTDKNRNKIGTSTETISATIIAGNDSEAITLSETGVAAGVFTGSLSITSSANPNQNNGTLEVNAPGSITLSYADSDDNTDSVSVSATLSVPGGGGVPILFGTNIPIYIPSSSQTSSSSSLPFSNPSSETTSQNENTASLSLAKLAGPFSFGQTSEQVRLLQEYLSRDKTIYPEGKITGYYGPLTRAAVGKFQERYGLAKASDDFYGLAGPITRAKLNEIFGNPPESGLGGNNQGLIEELKKQIEILQNQVATLLEEKLLELQNKLSQ